MELVDPNAALHLKAAGIRQVVSSDQLKLSVLAQSCLCPGWSAVVANFLESRSPLPPRVRCGCSIGCMVLMVSPCCECTLEDFRKILVLFCFVLTKGLHSIILCRCMLFGY